MINKNKPKLKSKKANFMKILNLTLKSYNQKFESYMLVKQYKVLEVMTKMHFK